MQNQFHAFREFTLTLQSRKGDWRGVLEIGEQEIRKALEYGFTQEELDEIKANLRRTNEAGAKSTATLQSKLLATQLAEAIHNDDVFLFGDEALALRLAMIDKLTTEDCRRALEDVWTQSAPRIFLVGNNLPPNADAQMIAAFKASRQKPVEAPTALKPVRFAYDDFGTPGNVVTRKHLADLDVWQVQFANGVRLNLKRTDFVRNDVYFVMRFGTGRVDEHKPGLAQWGSSLLHGGLGRHTRDELQRAVSGRRINLGFSVQDDAFVFRGDWRATELPLALRYATAHLTDAAFRPESERRVKEGITQTYSRLLGSPQSMVQTAIMPFLAGGDPRFGIAGLKRTASGSVQEFQNWITPALQNGCVEIAIVGDIDIDATIAEVAKTFGALPNRSPKPDLNAKTKLKFPSPPQEKHLSFTASNRPALVAFYWPIHSTFTPDDLPRFRLLANALQDRLRLEIREDQGETYSPRASFTHHSAYPGHAYIQCQMLVQPSRVDTVASSVRRLVARLAEDGVSDEELARLKLLAVNTARTQLRYNSHWAETLVASQEKPARLEELRTAETSIQEITKASVDKNAAKHLAARNTFLFVAEPQPPKDEPKNAAEMPSVN